MSDAAPSRRTAVSALALVLVAGVCVGACGGGDPGSSPRSVVASAPAPRILTRASSAQVQPRPAAKPARAPAPAAHAAPPPAHPVPAAFRIAPGAPSDAEVRRELLQMYRIQRQERQLSQLSPAAGSLLYLLPWSLEPKVNQISVASVFRDYGLGLACGGVLGRNQLGVAHKTAPCGTLIQFRYGGRQLVVPVIDRGPYVAGREWDLTGAAADALGFPGLGQIAWSVVG